MIVRDAKTYRAWATMKDRCNNPNNPRAFRYLERGISYQASWETFTGFFADMGIAPVGKQLDRIDNDGDYTKDNCRWVTCADNIRNSTTAKLNVQKVSLIKGLLRAAKPGVVPAYIYATLGDLFKVNPATIRDIAKGFTWKEIV